MNVFLDFLFSVLGDYTFQAFSLGNTFLCCYICIALFSPGLGRRNFFSRRLALSLLEGLALCFLLAIWYTEVDTLLIRVLCYFLLTLINFGALLFCWKDSLPELLLTFCCGMAAWLVTGKLRPLIQNLLGINDKETISFVHGAGEPITNWEWLLYIAFHAVMYLLLAFLPVLRRML